MTKRIADQGYGIEWLALCPLLAVSDTVINALGISIAVLIVVPLSVAAALVIRRWLNDDTLLAGTMLLIAAIVACVELVTTAWFHDLRQSLGMFLPLIIANVAIISSLQSRDSPPGPLLADGLKLGLVIAATLLVLSLARELVGRGSLLHGASMLSAAAGTLEIKVFRVDMGFLLALLPPGAFISLGLLLAARNWLHQKKAATRP